MSVDTLALTTNFIITLLCGCLIVWFFSSKKIQKHSFYYLWSLGFFLYAFEIFTRTFFENEAIVNVLFVGAFFSFSAGLSLLNPKKPLLVLIVTTYLITVSLTLIWLFTDFLPYTLGLVFGAMIFYGGTTLLLFYHRVKFGKIADRLIFGWLLLCASNIILFDMGWITDFFAIISKLIILMGLIDQDFAIMTQKIQRGMLPYFPPHNIGFENEGKFTLILSSNLSSVRKVKYMLGKIRENIEKGINTYIFSFQDVISYRHLRRMKWANPERVFIFIFSASAEKAKKEFTVLKMDITQIGATLSEIVKRGLNPKKTRTMILMDLSLLIHVFGVYPVYNLLLNKRGALREGGVDLFAFFNSETHNGKSVVSLFESISDEVLKL